MIEPKKSQPANISADGELSNSENNLLTTRQGHPVYDNQNLRTIGERGPATLENYHFLEKISHFDRERVPERVVHARGAGAHGVFESYGTVGTKPAFNLHQGKSFSGKRKRNTFICTFFNRNSRWKFSRNFA